MGQKINLNIYIVIISITVMITMVFLLITYGITENYANEFNISSLKGFINSSLPIVEYTYDSGKMEFSILTDLRDGIYEFTGVDASNPVKMLGNDSVLHKYLSDKYWKDSLIPEEPDYPNDPGDSEDPIVTYGPKPSQTIGPNTTQNPTNPLLKEGKYAKGDIITVKNGSNLNIDMNKILKDPFHYKFNNFEDPQILIYHTHTTECYIKDLSEIDNNNYDSWSSDNSKTVVRVGHELDNVLSKQYGFNVIHNSTVHNDKYTESYNKSSITVRNVLKGNPSIKLSIDIHRDGLALGAGKLRVVQNIKGEDCAKIMFVVGSDENASNPRWEDNLRLSVLLAEKLEEIAPGIVRYISVRSGRYNQHIAENGLLIEFGGDGNTVNEVTASAKYLAMAINEIFKN